MQLYKYKIIGILHWGYNFYNSQFSLEKINPYQVTDAGGAFPSGDAFLVYPGEDRHPEESIRMMCTKRHFRTCGHVNCWNPWQDVILSWSVSKKICGAFDIQALPEIGLLPASSQKSDQPGNRQKGTAIT